MKTPQQIADILAVNPCAVGALAQAEVYAAKLSERLVAQNTPPNRQEIAQRLYSFAAYAVRLMATIPDLGGLDRRALVLWAARGLVEACYAQLPRGPILFTLEAYLGGTIRRALAFYLGDAVSKWLEGFIELHVARLRIATHAGK